MLHEKNYLTSYKGNVGHEMRACIIANDKMYFSTWDGMVSVFAVEDTEFLYEIKPSSKVRKFLLIENGRYLLCGE